MSSLSRGGGVSRTGGFVNDGETTPAPTFNLPDIGASADTVLSPAEERRLGRAFMRGVRSSVALIEDPVHAEYIQDLGLRLAEQSQSPHKHFSFFLVEDPVINAFAGPGGYIGVHSGLVLETQNESELASVVAHEIAHITQNHLFRAFDQFSRMTGPAALAMLGAILLGSVSGQAAAAAIAGVQAGLAQAELNFTRANEEEADREGIKILAQAGYDPRSMAVFFERMGKTTRLYESSLYKIPEFLQSHPVTPNRIADALGRADVFPYRQPPVDPRYYLLRATLKVKSFKTQQEAVEHFRDALAEGRYRNEDAERYGYALALQRARRFEAAEQELGRLLKKEPGNPAYLIAVARLDQAQGRAKAAMNTLEGGLKLNPGSYPLNISYAELLIDNGQATKAKGLLTELQRGHGEGPDIYKLLARAAETEGRGAESHGYMAEYYYANGQLEPAVLQLEIAMRDKNMDFYTASKIEARWKILKAELKELKKRDRELVK